MTRKDRILTALKGSSECAELTAVIRVIEHMTDELVEHLFDPATDLDHLRFVRAESDTEKV